MSLPFERCIVLDFESAWCSKTYTLRKMTTEEYVRDPRFRAWGVCVKEVGSADKPKWLRDGEIRKWAKTIDWSKTAVLAHNAQFDVTVLSWIYGVHPCFIFDTLSMARAKRGVEAGNSLEKLAEAFELPAKGNALTSTDGILEGPLDPLVEQELADYCRHDTWLCEQIFLRLLEDYPKSELRLIDLTLKMYTRPLLELDAEMLEKAIDEERETREGLLQRLGVEEAELASNAQFAELLKQLGVQPPMKKKKPTKKTPHPVGMNFAFAKTDAMFQALVNGDREDVALLCEARLKVKSTTERTRAQRFLDIARRGRLPVPLSYYGALSGRWTASKGSAINMQNLKRGSFLRKAIVAPEGHVVGIVDLSQIEPRVLAWLADYMELLDIFRAGGDPYAAFGAQMFAIPGMTKDTHPTERQSAKSALLGAGYQLGWASFAAQLLPGFLGAPPKRYTREEAKQLGVTRWHIEKFLGWDQNLEKMAEIPHACTDEELLVHCLAAKMIIDKYRAAAWPVTAFWEQCADWIERCLVGGEVHDHKGVLQFRRGEIELVNGMTLKYKNLHWDKKEQAFIYDGEKGPTKLYAGKVTNNVTQALARIVMTDGMLRIAKRYPIVGSVHDQADFLLPEDEKEEGYKWALGQMTIEPKYMSGIPLAADGGVHRRYGEAKA
jgi:hypothetical protein